MKKKYFILALLSALVAMPALADRYEDCKQRASQSTGYYGSNPSRHEGGKAFLKGLAIGGGAGAIGGAISGGKAGKGAKVGAALGGLFALIKHGARKSQDRDIRRNYHAELNACMGTR
jgi:hypothetical protein